MRHLLDLFAPSTCDGCGARAAPPWCAACAAASAGPARPCAACGGPDAPGHGCWCDGVVAPDGLVALLRWTGPVVAALGRAKDVGRREVFRAGGRQLGTAVAAAGHVVDVVVPVPTDRRRARRRGTDHTAALARGVGAALQVPWQPLVRATGALPDRGRVAAGARPPLPTSLFAVVGRVPPAVLVVDDVVTTGATLAAVVTVLRSAGARTVVAGVLARAGDRPLGAR